jgi:hypothetical protein
MSWITLSAGHLKSAMTSKEVTDFGRTVTDGEPEDRMVPVLADLTQEIRGMIASWTQNTLSADTTTIPESFKTRALAIARYRLLITIPGYNPGEGRKLEYEKAETFFRDVARGIIRPEAAEDAVTPDVPSEKPAGAEWCAPGSRTGRERMSGL